MNAAVPKIYCNTTPEPRLGWVGRLIAAGVALGCLAVLVTATQLRPDENGVGTHRQLGMHPCGMLTLTGVPCPTCGMTTSFTHLLAGNVWRSFVTQPAGFLMAIIAAVAVWIGFYSAITGLPGPRHFRSPSLRQVIVIFAIVLLAWGWKIISVVSG